MPFALVEDVLSNFRLVVCLGQAKMERMLTWMLAPAVHGIAVSSACLSTQLQQDVWCRGD